MENANGGQPSGKRQNPQSRRWYGYVDVVTPSGSPTKQPQKPAAPSPEQQRSVSGIAERNADEHMPAQLQPIPKEVPIWPSAPASTVREFGPASTPQSEQAATTKPADQLRKKRSRYLAWRAMVLYVLAGVLFAAGGWVAWQGFRTNQQIEDQITQVNEQAEDDGSNPSTTPVSAAAIDGYAVAPDMPRVLTIGKLGVKARVLPLGVTASNKLKAPSNIHDVGWYNASSKPGQPGAVLVDGHVSSWESAGVFKNLKQLTVGDEIAIERGDGQVIRYRVVRSQAYDEAETDMRAALQPVTAGKNGLNLITCYGRVKPGTSEFEQRLIVFAEQI